MGNLLTINFVAENNDIELFPQKGSLGAGGYDLKSNEDIIIPYGEIKKISTGIKIEIPKNYVGILVGRSSTFCKGIICNLGIIDSDYRGDIQLVVLNQKQDKTDFIVSKYDRIGQILIMPIENQFIFTMAETLSNTNRGTNGFGSTGN